LPPTLRCMPVGSLVEPMTISSSAVEGASPAESPLPEQAASPREVTAARARTRGRVVLMGGLSSGPGSPAAAWTARRRHSGPKGVGIGSGAGQTTHDGRRARRGGAGTGAVGHGASMVARPATVRDVRIATRAAVAVRGAGRTVVARPILVGTTAREGRA